MVECDVTLNSSWSISATVRVYINVIDVNDNAPIFNSTSSYVIELAEDTPIGDTVAVVMATDADEGERLS